MRRKASPVSLNNEALGTNGRIDVYYYNTKYFVYHYSVESEREVSSKRVRKLGKNFFRIDALLFIPRVHVIFLDLA